jgi:hypothetical protein
MFWNLPNKFLSVMDVAIHLCLRSFITLCFLLSLCYYLGWIERWIWWKIEDEASILLNRAKVTIGSFRLDFTEILQGKLTAHVSNVMLHTPQRDEWGWESPLVARIGKAKVECNAPITLFHLVFFKQDLPIELYTLVLSDIQVFVERYESVINVYLMDPCCVVPSPPFPNGKTNEHSATVDEETISNNDENSSSDSSRADTGTHHEKAQQLVDEMLGSVESLGRAARRGNFTQTIRQHGLELADRIREGLGKKNRSNADKKQQLAEGVKVLRTAGKVAVKSLQSTPQLIQPERLMLNPKPPPLCRVGRIAITDARIFTKDSWIQLQDEDNTTNSSSNTGSSNNKGGWNKPIFIESMIVRAAEMCPPMSLKDDDDLPAVYQTIDKVLEIVWRRLLAEMAKSNTGKLFSTAMFEVLNLMKASAISSHPTGSAATDASSSAAAAV